MMKKKLLYVLKQLCEITLMLECFSFVNLITIVCELQQICTIILYMNECFFLLENN